MSRENRRGAAPRFAACGAAGKFARARDYFVVADATFDRVD